MATTLRELITKLVFRTDKGGLDVYNKSVRQTKGLMGAARREARMMKKELGGIIPGVRSFIATLVAGRVSKFLTFDYAADADQAAKAAKAAGTTVETYQGLAHAFRLAGGDIAELNKALPQLGKRALEVTQGNKTMAMSFRELEVDVRRGDGTLKNQDELLYDIADRFAAMEDGSRKTGLAMQIMGRTGAKLLPLFSEGAEGIKRAIEEAKKLGLVMSADQAASAEKFNDTFLRAKSVVLGLRNMLAAELLPAITAQLEAFWKWAVQGDNMRRLLDRIKDGAKVAAVALGAFVAVKIVKAICVLAGAAARLKIQLALVGRAALVTATRHFMVFRAALASTAIPIKAFIGLLQRLRKWIIAVGVASGISAKSILFFKGVMTGALGAGKAFIRLLKVLALTLIRVGKAALFAGGKVFLIVASIAFLALLIEDLVGYVQGRDSLFGRMFGGTAYGEAVRDVLVAIAAEARAIGREFAPLGAAIAGAFRSLFKALNVDLAGVVKFLAAVLKAVLYLVLYMVLYILKAITWLVRKIKAIPGAIGDAWDWIAAKGKGAADSVKEAWENVLAFFALIVLKMKAAWDWLGDRIKEVGYSIAKVFKDAYKEMKSLWDKTKGFMFGGEVNTKWVTAQAIALREKVQQNNTVQSPTVNVHISGSANMSAEEVARRAEEGTVRGWNKLLEREFGDWGKVTP